MGKTLGLEQGNKIISHPSKRDGYIDFFKGLLILWVIHIHTVFWSGTYYLPNKVREASLIIDVAVFFFISGYLSKIDQLLKSMPSSLEYRFVQTYSFA